MFLVGSRHTYYHCLCLFLFSFFIFFFSFSICFVFFSFIFIDIFSCKLTLTYRAYKLFFLFQFFNLYLGLFGVCLLLCVGVMYFTNSKE